jgi:hypothetical protein
MKSINQFFACSILLLIVLGCRIGESSVAAAVEIKADTLLKPLRVNDTVTICAVGDIMLGSAYPLTSNLPPKDGINSFKHVAPFLKGDVIFGNLEGCFAFRMPERYAGIIKNAGFNLLSIANNHVGDFGARGRKRTVEILDSLNIKYAGLQSHPSSFFEKDSIKYAFCAFSPNENTVSINELTAAKELVEALKRQANIVIVSFHGGGEGLKFEHVPKKREIFYEENRGNVYEFAHAVIDAGADIVLGHGPHVTRAVELYKNKFIAYSLGNFCTYGMFNLKGLNGFAPLMQIQLTPSGDFLSAKVISVRQDKIRGLTLDPNNLAFEKLRSLTDTDFPGHGLTFADSRIKKRED